MKQAEFTIKGSTWAVLIILSLLAWFLFGAWLFAEENAEPVRPPKVERLTLPQQCAKFSRDPDPDSWDPVAETYPRNIEWENCMGVGPK